MPRSPREFVSFVARHYHLLVAMSDEPDGFQSDDEITAFIRSHTDSSNPGRIAGDMKQLGVLNQSTGEWAMPPFLTRFLGALQERHILATPGVVRAWVNRLGDLAEKLSRLVNTDGGAQLALDDESGRDLLHEIGDSIYVVSTTISDNIERIGQEVTAYRSTEDSIVMRSRLRRLVELYEGYLEPVLTILDTTGSFQAVTQQIVTLCARITARERSVDSGLAADAGRLRRQVTWLRRTILRQADEASKELAPLCLAAARESNIARGVNRALMVIQEGRWGPLALSSLLQIVSDQDSSLAGDDAIAAFMQDAYKLRQQAPPRIVPEEPDSLAIPMSTTMLRERLDGIDEIDDLLAWINQECDGSVGADGSVNLLFRLIDMDRDRFQSDGQVLMYDYEQVAVEVHQWMWSRSNGR